MILRNRNAYVHSEKLAFRRAVKFSSMACISGLPAVKPRKRVETRVYRDAIVQGRYGPFSQA